MTIPTACGKGMWSAAGATVCTDCPVGKYCERPDTTETEKNNNSCANGYRCPLNTRERPFNDHDDQFGLSAAFAAGGIGTKDGYSCPKGKYCSVGVENDCAAGTYNANYGGTSSSSCLATPKGFYTDTAGSSDFITNKCPAGHYCIAGTSNKQALVCKAGTFRRTLGGTHQDDCGACPSGFWCPEQSAEPMECPQGYYCPESSEFPLPCPIGTFGAGKKLTAVGDCTTCYGGRFCSQYGLIEPDGNCDPGFYCVDKSMTPVPKTLHVGSVGNVCEAGGFCPTTTKYPLPCPPG